MASQPSGLSPPKPPFDECVECCVVMLVELTTLMREETDKELTRFAQRLA